MTNTRTLDKYNRTRTEYFFNALNGRVSIDNHEALGIRSKYLTDLSNQENVNIFKAFKNNKFIAINGEKASGKTSFVNWITWYLSKGFTKKLPEPIGLLHPFVINFSKIEISNKSTVDSIIIDCLSIINENKHILSFEDVISLLNEKKLLLIFEDFTLSKNKNKTINVLKLFCETYDNYTIITKSETDIIPFFKNLKLIFQDDELMKNHFKEEYYEMNNETNLSLFKYVKKEDIHLIKSEKELLDYSFENYQFKIFPDLINSSFIRKSLFQNKYIISKIIFEININKKLSKSQLLHILNKDIEHSNNEIILNNLLIEGIPLIKESQDILVIHNQHIGDYLSAFYVENQIKNPEYFEPDIIDPTIDSRFSNLDKKMLKKIKREHKRIFEFLLKRLYLEKNWIKFIVKSVK